VPTSLEETPVRNNQYTKLNNTQNNEVFKKSGGVLTATPKPILTNDSHTVISAYRIMHSTRPIVN